MPSKHDILSEALKLTREDRAELAHRLLHSLEDDADDVDAADEWDRELERRARELLDGTVKGIPLEEVRSEIAARRYRSLQLTR